MSTINGNVAILIYSALHALKNQRSAMLVERRNIDGCVRLFLVWECKAQPLKQTNKFGSTVVVAQDTALHSEQQHQQKRFVSTINGNVAILIYSALHALKNQRSAMLVERTNIDGRV